MVLDKDLIKIKIWRLVVGIWDDQRLKDWEAGVGQSCKKMQVCVYYSREGSFLVRKV